MPTYLSTNEVRQGSANFSLGLDFTIDGYSSTYLAQTWKVKIVLPDGSTLLKTTADGVEVLTDYPRIYVPIVDNDLIQAGKYWFQVTLTTGGANVNSRVGSFTIESSLPEGITYTISSSSLNHFPIFTYSNALIASDLVLNGANLEFLTGGLTLGTYLAVQDSAYGVGWDGSLRVPTRNAVYDKIQSLTTADVPDSTDRRYITDATAVINTAVARSVFLESYANLDAAVTAIGATVTDLIITNPTTTTTSSLTIPRTTRLVFQGAGQITIAAGHTLTVGNMLDPDSRKCFVLANSSTSHLYFLKGAIKAFNTAWITGTNYASVTATEFTNAVNLGLAICANTGDARLYIPEGLWLSNGGHVINETHSNLTIFGDGNAQTQYSTTIQLNQATTDLFEVTTSVTSPEIGDLKFRGLMLYGNNKANSYGIRFHAAVANTIRNVSLEGVGVADFTEGIYVNANSAGWQIQAFNIDSFSKFVTNSDVGIHIDAENSGFNIESNIYCGYNAYGVKIHHAGAVNFKGMEFAGVNQGSANGNYQVEKQTVSGSIGVAGAGTMKSVVTAAGMTGSPRTVNFEVANSDTASQIAAKQRKALDADPYVTSFFAAGGSGADVYLITLDRAANDPTMNFTTEKVTATGTVADNLTSTNTEAGVANSAGLAKAAVYCDGQFNNITFTGCQEEGFESSFSNNAALLSQQATFTGCTIQSPMRLNADVRLTLNGCRLANKIIRDASGSNAVVTLNNCNVEDVYRTLGNPSTGYTAMLRSNNFGHVVGNCHMAMEVGTFSDNNYAPATTFRVPTRVIPNLLQDTSVPMTTILHRSGQSALRIGLLGDMDNTGYYYDFTRNGSTGYLDITGNQTGYTGINVAGVVQANTVLVDDSAYGAGWDGSLAVPTRNAVYDKIQSMTLAIGQTITSGTNGSVLFVGSGALAQNNTSFYWDDSNTQLKLTAGSSTKTPLYIKLAASQTADAFQVYASDGTTKRASINAGGDFRNDSGGGLGPCWVHHDYGFIGVGAGSWFRMGNAGQVSWDSDHNGATLTPDTGFARYSAGVIKATNGTATNIKYLIGGGASVASASALPLPTGNVFHVTGTTNITSITSTNFQAGVEITLIFDGALTFTDGSNLKLAGDFVTTADDTITLVYDGTNWYEVCRSVN